MNQYNSSHDYYDEIEDEYFKSIEKETIDKLHEHKINITHDKQAQEKTIDDNDMPF